MWHFISNAFWTIVFGAAALLFVLFILSLLFGPSVFTKDD